MTEHRGEGGVVTRLMTRGRVSNTVAMLALLAVVVGYFLPWTNFTPSLEGLTGINKTVASRRAGEEAGAKAAGRLAQGEVLTGAEWAAALDHIAAEVNLDERQLRRLEIARIGVRLLPWATVLLCLILLLLAVPPARVAWLGPGAAVFGVAQSRLLSAFLLTLVLACALIVFLVGDMMLAGATLLGEEESRTGKGLILLCCGSGVAFVSAFVGFGAGRLRALIVAAVLVLGLGVLAWVRTHG
ncbi:MAG: hypothetical protein R3F30_14275 [Planctomycetota bacterium]